MANVYTGAMGMISFQNKLDVIGNNIANSRSNGYKKDHETFSVFEEGLRRIISNDKTGVIGKYQEEVHTDDIQTNFDPGLLQVTESPLDVSLQNKTDENGNKSISFFEVGINGEKRLTRDGHFQLDEERNLSLMNGAFLLDVNGNRIQIPNGVEATIDKEGRVLNKESGEEIAKLQIRTVDKENTGYLKKTEGSMFKVMTVADIQDTFGPLDKVLGAFDTNQSLLKVLKNKEVLTEANNTGQINIFNPVNNVTVASQTLEQSNVDIAYEMNELMLAQKGFQANSKAVTTFDKVNEKDANQIGA